MNFGWTRNKKDTTPGASPSGAEAELMAEQYLLNQGLKLLQRNFSCRQGEIDLVMDDRGTTVFVEVRFRKAAHYGLATETVTAAKQRKLLATAEHYLLRYKRAQNKPARFDIVGIMPGASGYDYTWLQNAFQG